MPDDEQNSTDTTPTNDTADENSDGVDTSEQSGGDADTGDDTPPEGKSAEEPFDAARAQAKIRKANQEAASLRKRLKDLEPLAEEARKAKEAQQTEAERLQSRLTEREQEITKLRQRAVRSEVRALAAPSFADPTDPEALLDLSGYVGDDGEIDTDQIKTDLADLLERKPHLGKPKPADTEPERKRRPAPDRTQASGANQSRAKDPADEFAAWANTRLLKGRR